MKRNEHVEFMKNDSARNKALSQRINELYEECLKLEYLSDPLFSELLNCTDRYAYRWVHNHLRNPARYLDDVMQASRLAILEIFYRKKEKKYDNFASVAFIIYRNKAMDVMRDIYDAPEPYDGKGEDGKSGTVPPPQGDPFENEDEKRWFDDDLLKICCNALMDSEEFPPKCLAYCSSAILPKLYYSRDFKTKTDETDDSNDKAKWGEERTRASKEYGKKDTQFSVKWAINYLKERTVDEITEDSQDTLKKTVDKRFNWGRCYIDQLEKYTDQLGEYTDQLEKLFINAGKRCMVKDLEYKEVPDKKIIAKWSKEMFHKVMKDAIGILINDKKMMELVNKYVITDWVPTLLVNGMEGKHR